MTAVEVAVFQNINTRHFIFSPLSSITSRRSRYIPASITAWILSLGPSVRYDRAQQASDSTSRSEWWISSARAGRHWHTALNGGGGFLLRQRFDSVHVTLRRNGTEVSALMWRSSGSRQPLLRTWSRRSGPSPVAHTKPTMYTCQILAQTSCTKILLTSPTLLDSQTITTPLIIWNKLIFTIHFSIHCSHFLLENTALGDTPIFSSLSSITLSFSPLIPCIWHLCTIMPLQKYSATLHTLDNICCHKAVQKISLRWHSHIRRTTDALNATAKQKNFFNWLIAAAQTHVAKVNWQPTFVDSDWNKS